MFLLRGVPLGGFLLIGKQFVIKPIKYQSILNRISFQILKAADEGCRRRNIPLPHIFKHLASPHLINMPESFTPTWPLEVFCQLIPSVYLEHPISILSLNWGRHLFEPFCLGLRPQMRGGLTQPHWDLFQAQNL